MKNTLQVIVPHVGEGIKHVQILKLLTSEGDKVEEDENLIEIETDKSVIEIPSMAAGEVKKILCKVGDVVEVGGTLMEIESEKKTENAFFSSQVRRGESRRVLPSKETPINDKFPDKQRKLAQNLKSSSEVVVGGFIEKAISFDDINGIRALIRSQNPKETPSCLAVIASAVFQAMFKFDKFKCQLDRTMNIIESLSGCIGIAVAGQMDTLDILAFVYKSPPELERLNADIIQKLKDQTSGPQAFVPSLVISDMSSYGIQRANPVVVYPAIATLFIGTPYYGFDKNGHISKLMNLCLSFDHRLINGAYAAEFVNEIEKNLRSVKKASSEPMRKISG